MSFNDYKDPIISQWHMSGGNKYSKTINNESHKVVSNMFALVGLPDISTRVIIDGYVEIGLDDKIEVANQFKVDYTNGYVFVHPSKEGLSINVSRYSSRGVNYYPASRVYTKVDDFGNVISSLEDTIDNIGNIENIKGKLDNSIKSARDIDTKMTKKPDGTIQTAKDLDDSLKSDTADAFRISRALRDDSAEGRLVHNMLGNSTNGSIKRANESLSNIVDATDIADDCYDKLLHTVLRGNERDVSLESNIKDSKETEIRLDKSTDEAIAINEKLSKKPDGTIQKAYDIDTKLGDTTDNAKTVDDKLQGVVDAGDVNIAEITDVIKNTALIYKEPVDSYSQIATKYPKPENGWFVNASSDKKWYRYNKERAKWEHITTFDGTVVDTMFNTSKFIWMETVDVAKGSKTFTLNNSIGMNDKLTIIDIKYQTEWLEGIHWTRKFNLITFTEKDGLFEDLTFRVTNIGKDMKLEMDDSKTILTNYTTARKSDLNAHTDIKKIELNNHTKDKKLELNTTIGVADSTKSKLDKTIGDANTIENTLSNSSIGTIKKANDKNVELNSTISKATVSNTNLDKSTTDANAINITLAHSANGTIRKAKDSNDTLQNTISSSTTAKNNLDGSIASGQAKKVELDNFVGVKKSELDTYVGGNKQDITNHTNDKKIELDNHTALAQSSLDNSITTANETKTKLDNSASLANSIEDKLSNKTNGTIKSANESEALLSSKVIEADSSYTLLDDKVIEANQSLSDLDGSITNGSILKGELDQIIDGTDYQAIIQDVDALKVDKADVSYVDNKVKTDVPVNAKFTDTIVDVSGKVDKISGKGLSTNDYTNKEKSDVAKISVLEVNKANKSTKEVKSVTNGSNKLTVTNAINSNDEIQIVDTKYGIKWFEGVHWNRVGQVITFTSAMLENMNFEIINMG